MYQFVTGSISTKHGQKMKSAQISSILVILLVCYDEPIWPLHINMIHYYISIYFFSFICHFILNLMYNLILYNNHLEFLSSIHNAYKSSFFENFYLKSWKKRLKRNLEKNNLKNTTWNKQNFDFLNFVFHRSYRKELNFNTLWERW